VTTATKNEVTHYFKRQISYTLTEDYIDLDNTRGGDRKYEEFVFLTD